MLAFYRRFACLICVVSVFAGHEGAFPYFKTARHAESEIGPTITAKGVTILKTPKNEDYLRYLRIVRLGANNGFDWFGNDIFKFRLWEDVCVLRELLSIVAPSGIKCLAPLNRAATGESDTLVFCQRW